MKYFNALTNYGTKRMLQMVTSNGKRWAERLNGAEAMTSHNVYSVIEKTRLERTHNGYRSCVSSARIFSPSFSAGLKHARQAAFGEPVYKLALACRSRLLPPNNN